MDKRNKRDETDKAGGQDYTLWLAVRFRVRDRSYQAAEARAAAWLYAAMEGGDTQEGLSVTSEPRELTEPVVRTLQQMGQQMDGEEAQP